MILIQLLLFTVLDNFLQCRTKILKWGAAAPKRAFSEIYEGREESRNINFITERILNTHKVSLGFKMTATYFL